MENVQNQNIVSLQTAEKTESDFWNSEKPWLFSKTYPKIIYKDLMDITNPKYKEYDGYNEQQMLATKMTLIN